MRKILHLLFILLLIFQGAAKAQDRIYWGVNGSDANISSAQLDGSDIRKSASVTTRQGYDMETDFYKKILYFGDGAYVKKCNLDGSDMKTIYTATSGWLIGGLALDLKNNKLYYSQFQQSVGIITIFRSNLDGTGIEPIITSTAGQTYNLAISQSLQKLYWTVANGATTTVYRSNLDGTGVETLASLGAFVPGICIDEDNQKLYLAYWQNNEVRSTDMTCSTAPTLLFGASNGTFQMSVSNVENKLYFGEMSTYKIRRCNLDGSSPQDIVSGLSGQIMALSIPTVPPAPTIYANETYTFELNDFIFSSVNKDLLTKIKITTLTSKGTIYLDANNNNIVDAGEEVALNQEISKTDLVAGKLKFNPVTNEYGSPYTTFTFNWFNGTSYSTLDYLQYIYVLSVTPTVTTQAVSDIGSTTATGNGNITNLGVPFPTSYGICWNTTGSPTTSNSKVDLGAGSATGPFTTAITGLTVNTTYKARAYAVNEAGTSYGAEVTFTTTSGFVAPTATTNAATSITSSGATLNGSINANNASTTVTFEYGLTTGYGTSVTAAQSPVTGTSATAVSYALSGLTPNTTYHYRVVGVNGGGTTYGADQTFTTQYAPQTISFGVLDNKTYGDAPYDLAATSTSGLPVSYSSDNTAVATVSGTTVTIVGAGTANIRATQEGNASYGAATPVSQILTVNALPVTITVDAGQSKVYSDTDPTLTYTVSPALIGTDAFTGTLSRTAGENVGNYAISQGTLSASSNYSLTFIGKDFSITPKAITVTTNAATKVYGEADPTLTYTVSPALVGTDAFTGSLTRATGENVGNYAISQGTLSAGSNYALTFIGKDFSITPKAITVTANATTKVYGEADPTFTYTVSPALVGSDAFTGSLMRATGENVGNYAISQGSLSAGSNYTVSFVGNKLAITPKQLTTTSPSVTTSKLYDGNTSAQIVSLGSLTGAIASDILNLSLSAEANYNDASLGSDKTITIIYTLSGGAASNYLTPAPSVIPGASIQDNITLATLSTPSPSCQGDDVLLNYQVLSGNPDTYTLTFGSQALAAGFSNKENIPVPSFKASESITIKVPAEIAGGTYTANLKMKGKLGNESPSYPFTFTINLSTDYLITKFNDVILFDNKSNRFNAFQWYKNGLPIAGATKQFYNDPDGLSGSYSVAVTTMNGEKLRTCDKVIVRTTPTKSKISVYPNPIKRNESSIISFSGIEKEEIESSTLVVYKMSGEKVYTNEHMSMTTQLRINLPAGIYIGNVVTSDKEVYSFKVVIE